MKAEDAGEQVFLVKYEGENTDRTHLRSAKSFIYGSNVDGLEDKAIVPTMAGRVMISIVGVNYDVDDGQIHDIKTCLSTIINDAPFTLQYDHISTQAATEEDMKITDEETKAEDSFEENVEPAKPAVTRELSMGGDLLDAADTDSPALKLDDDIESATVKDIHENLVNHVKSPKVSSILNPFGEPLSDADIQYAFEKCDENNDQRIQLKEFKKALAGMGLDLDADEIKKFFKSVDENHDNVLDYSEFKSALTSMQPDYVDIWSQWLSKGVLDMAPDNDTPSIEEIAKLLSNKRANWKDRITHMHAFAKHAVQKMGKSKFDKIMRPIREPLILQLTDRRSAVVRECCIVIAKVAIVQKGKMTRWAPRILEALFSVIRMKVEIMNISAHQAAKAVVRCVPDNKKLDLLNKLKAATLEKGYAVVRQRAFQYIFFLVKDIRKNKSKKSGKFWEKIMNMVVNGIQDASNLVREEAALVCCELYLKNEERTRDAVISQLRRATQKKFFETFEEYKKSNTD